jgi:hypothetical protein
MRQLELVLEVGAVSAPTRFGAVAASRLRASSLSSKIENSTVMVSLAGPRAEPQARLRPMRVVDR